MKLVILESPFRGANLAEREENVEYTKRCARRCALDNEAILASHLLFPQFLDEDRIEEQTLGIKLGLAWRRVADLSVFFTDRGWSYGMKEALGELLEKGGEFRLRSLDQKVDLPPLLGADDFFFHFIDMERGVRK